MLNKKIVMAGIAMLVFAALFASATGPGGGAMTVTILPGEHYTHRKWFFLYPAKLTPTMAVWIEDEEGFFKGTLFVTKKAAEGSWTGAKERPEALPVYFARQRAAADRADSVSGATPPSGKSARIDSDLDPAPGTYRVFAEVNVSFDYNDAYPKDRTGVDGQPSLVYAGRLTVGRGAAEAVLDPLGTGNPAARDGEIRAGTEGLTTALGIVEKIIVETRI